MNDYKELITDLREEAEAVKAVEWDIPICTENHIREAADAIEQLVRERDCAVADLRNALMNDFTMKQCYYCKHQEKDGQCHHDCIHYTAKWGWEWRGIKEGKI